MSTIYFLTKTNPSDSGAQTDATETYCTAYSFEASVFRDQVIVNVDQNGESVISSPLNLIFAQGRIGTPVGKPESPCSVGPPLTRNERVPLFIMHVMIAPSALP